MDIKLFVACHKDCNVISNRTIIPVQVGAALTEKRFDGMLPDNEGDHISDKNQSYCELTAQYWAWKNQNADYYGLMHYRRYFSFNPNELPKECWVDEKGAEVYDRVYGHINQKNIAEACIDESIIAQYVQQYDIISTIPDESNITVYEHYKNAPHHRIEDLTRVTKIIAKYYPEYLPAAKEYLNSKKMYFCNMFIMRKDIFFEYNEWLFGILEKYSEKSDFSDYTINEYRAAGFLGERLLGIYLTWIKKNKQYKISHLQRVLFKNTDKDVELKPAFDNNNIPVVIACDDCYAPYAAAVISSIIKHSSTKNNLDFIIMERNVSEQNKKLLIKSFEMHQNVSCRFYNMLSRLEAGWDEHFPTHYPLEVNYRLFAPEILSNYNKYVYIDCDTVVRADIAELYNIDMTHYYYAMSKDLDYMGNLKINADFRKQALLHFDKELLSDYRQSGVMVFNAKKMREKFNAHDLMTIMINKQFRFPDQDLLNYIMPDRSKIYLLPQTWNFQADYTTTYNRKKHILAHGPANLFVDYLNAEKNPKIVHFCIPPEVRPWVHPELTYADEWWNALRDTFFYEIVLARLAAYNVTIRLSKENYNLPQRNSNIDNFIAKWLPANSRRRSFAKKIYSLLK